MKENNENTMKRINELNNVIKIDIKWECEVRKELKKDKEMNSFFNDNGNEKGPINPRSSYFGGRTGYVRF
jgi:G:T-mismatch repair DNA endonuclease (very short patch repair protein)